MPAIDHRRVPDSIAEPPVKHRMRLLPNLSAMPDTCIMAKSHAHAASFRRLLEILELLGYPIRVVILQRLSGTPMSAGELARMLPIKRTAIVQHLKCLEAARLVDATMEARRRIYRVRPEGFRPLRRWLDRFDAG
jgi:DNA-binding transcriptional ArsR family regulator